MADLLLLTPASGGSAQVLPALGLLSHRVRVLPVEPSALVDAPDADIVVKIPAQTFKEMLAKLRNPALTLAKDAEVTKGSKIDFLKFMALFQPPSK